MKLLFLMNDRLPAFRPDVTVLFGKALLQRGVQSDLLGQRAQDKSMDEACRWPAGRVFVHGVESYGLLGQIMRPLHDLALIRRLDSSHEVIQVRDKIRTGLLALLVARLTGRKFVYWMSFPFAEGFKVRARQVGASQGRAKQLFFQLRAVCADVFYYRLLVPYADHLFVQSDAMLEYMVNKGASRERMTAVPMGVDLSTFESPRLTSTRPPELQGRRVLAYLGSVGQSRQSDFLLDVLRLVVQQVPDAMLLLVGDGASPDEQAWMREAIARSGLSAHVLLTGWLAQDAGLALMRHADVGLSPIPRGELFDVSSPTKAVEYLALGLPCVGNDIPDQKLVIEESEAGLCVPMEAAEFAQACVRLLTDSALAARCASKGPVWVSKYRSYEVIADRVADQYRRLAKKA